MEKNNAIIKSEENSQLGLYEKERTLSIDVATEMSKGYEDIQYIIELLKKDTRIDDVLDDDDHKIGQRTHLHSQLLKWVIEARHTITDMWHIGGGEIAQEAEKELIKVKGKLIMEIVGKTKKERDEIVKRWKQSVSFKR